MDDNLLESVRNEVLARLTQDDVTILESHVSDFFNDAVVILQSRNLRLRVRRNRGQILVDFGPISEPGTWFDSDLVLAYLGSGTEASLSHDSDQQALSELVDLINSRGAELSRIFAVDQLARTKAELSRDGEQRAERLFGWRSNRVSGQ